MTVGQLRDLISEFFSNETRPVETEKKNLVYGLRGIMSLLHCSHTMAQRYKDGILKEAVMQNGRKIVVDADKALELFKRSGKCLWLFARGLSTVNKRRGFVLLAISRTENVIESEAMPSLPSQTSSPSSPSLQSSQPPQIQENPEAIKSEPSLAERDGNDVFDGIDGKERQYMPTFYQQIKGNLPSFLKQVVKVRDSDADADLLILGTLSVISACLPGIYGHYDHRLIYPNLFLFVTARAGSGKGRLIFCKAIVEPIHDERLALNRKKGGPNEKTLQKPHLLFLPANSSSTAIYQSLADNNEQGLMFETEGDTLATALGQDFGDFSDGLRKALHHEAISYLRRSENEYVNIKNPRLSVVLSGTPGQVVRLIESVENGLFSRFLFYYLDQKTAWHDVFDEDDSEPLDQYFYRLGQEYIDFYHKLEQQPEIRVKLTTEQARRFHQHFVNVQDSYEKLFGEEIIASVRRLGLSTFRIAMILSALRIMEEGDYSSPRICRDDDFETAMAICEVLQEHMLRVFQLLPASTPKTAGGRKVETLLDKQLWENTPEEFETKDFKAIAKKLGMAPATAKRRLSKWTDEKLLIKIDNGKYMKAQNRHDQEKREKKK